MNKDLNKPPTFIRVYNLNTILWHWPKVNYYAYIKFYEKDKNLQL